MTEYVDGKKYTLDVSSRGPWPFDGKQEATWDGERFVFEEDNGDWVAIPGIHSDYFTVVEDEPTWTLPDQWVTARHAEWAAQTVDTLAQVGIPTEDIPNALRLVARLHERGIENPAEVAGLAYVWLVASDG